MSLLLIESLDGSGIIDQGHNDLTVIRCVLDMNEDTVTVENTGIDLEFYNLRERSEDELFPWDFIDIGVSRKFLRREWERAMKETVTPNCRMQCSSCGAAKFGGGVCYESKN